MINRSDLEAFGYFEEMEQWREAQESAAERPGCERAWRRRLLNFIWSPARPSRRDGAPNRHGRAQAQ